VRKVFTQWVIDFVEATKSGLLTFDASDELSQIGGGKDREQLAIATEPGSSRKTGEVGRSVSGPSLIELGGWNEFEQPMPFIEHWGDGVSAVPTK